MRLSSGVRDRGEPFIINGIAKLKGRGLAKVNCALTLRMIAYNLIRILKLRD
jgi:hypothetical protein